MRSARISPDGFRLDSGQTLRLEFVDAERRIPVSDEKGTLAGMRIGAVPHPGVLLSLADGAVLPQDLATRPAPHESRHYGPQFLQRATTRAPRGEADDFDD
jgi:hypothetical protein